MTRKKKQWTEGTWKGLRQLQCNQCPWDTLEGEAAMLKHIQDVHTPKPPRKVTSRLPLVDRYGNPVVVEKEVIEDGAD